MPTRSRKRLGYGGGAVEKTVNSEITGYNPNPVSENSEDLRRFLDSELHRIRDAFDEIYDNEPDVWIALTLNSGDGWIDAGADPSYYLDRNRVYLKGAISTGTSGTVAFTLPAGYRPSEQLYFPVLQTGGAAGAILDVNTNGEVTVVRTAAVVHLNNISFRV